MALWMFSSVWVLSPACGRAAGFSGFGLGVALAPGRRRLTLLAGSRECRLPAHAGGRGSLGLGRQAEPPPSPLSQQSPAFTSALSLLWPQNTGACLEGNTEFCLQIASQPHKTPPAC